MGEPFHNSIRRSGRSLNQKEVQHRPQKNDESYQGVPRHNRRCVPIKLAVSLVSADDSLRTRLMPVNKRWPLAELKEALLAYQESVPKRLTLEYCMLSGVNTTGESARQVELFTRGLDVIVNLIAWNPIDELEFSTPSEEEQKAFSALLNRYRVKHTLRISRGRTIGSADNWPLPTILKPKIRMRMKKNNWLPDTARQPMKRLFEGCPNPADSRRG